MLGILRRPLIATLYAAVTLSANPLAAADIDRLADMRQGDMRKLLFSEPRDTTDVSFTSMEGEEETLASFKGKTILLNFWATWCTPCRKEMPSLDALRAELGSDTFDVITVATGPQNQPKKIDRFFEKNEISDLPVYLDPDSRFGAAMGVRGLPITVILNQEGKEIARMRGDADWASEDAIEIIEAILAQTGG